VSVEAGLMKNYSVIRSWNWFQW